MKNFLTVLTLLLATITISCSNDEPVGGGLKFNDPVIADISGVTATVSCKIDLNDASLNGATVGFFYGAEQDDLADYTELVCPKPNGSIVEVRLSDLSPLTNYNIYCFARWGREGVLYSKTVSFRTLSVEAGDNPAIDVTSKKTMVVAADGGEQFITYEIVNPIVSGIIKATCETAWVKSFTYDAQAGEIAFSVDVNAGDERTAIINLTYPQAQSVNVTVNQEAAKGGEPEEPGESKTVSLNENSGWPTTYNTSTVQLGDYKYNLVSVADYGNGIQFKSAVGSIANNSDMGAITKIEIVYLPKTVDKNIKLYMGTSENPTGTMITSVSSGDTEIFDCSKNSAHYFKLLNDQGAAYLKDIKIHIGEGGTTPPDPADPQPTFGTPSHSNVTKTTATLTCQLNYTGTKTISDAGFSYISATAGEKKITTTTIVGTKTANLTGLAAGTLYSYNLYVVIDGKTYKSNSGSFMTEPDGENPPPTGGDTFRAGWAELPTEPAKANDYYYAHHMCPDVYVTSGGSKKRNYSICFSANYVGPMWTVMPQHPSYNGSSKRTDKWAYDPAIPENIQPNLKKSYGGGYNRGHMVGSGERLTSAQTNYQTFYYTNMSPQGVNFNTGGGAWNNLEDYVDNFICSDTLYIVTGCVYGSGAKKISAGGKSVTVPTDYYKLLLRTKKGNSGKSVMTAAAADLQCVAFWVSHSASMGTKPSRSNLKSVAEIEALTGFRFFDNVPNAPKTTFNASDWNL